MATLVGCDYCGGVADPSFAEFNWIMVAWREYEQVNPLQTMITGQQQQVAQQRHFCSLDCLGIWASCNEAIKHVGGR